MKTLITKSTLNALAVSGVAGLAMAQSLSAATILNFGGIGANGTAVPENYGSNEVGTANIALDWGNGLLSDGWDSYPNWDGRGDVAQTDYAQSNPMSVAFTSDTATIGVVISSFDLDEFAGGGDSSVSWAVKNGATTIVSGTWNDFNTANDAADAGGRSTVNTGMTTAQAIANAGSVITLELTLDSGAGSFQAMDNLSFDQVAVPEPSSSLLAAAGIGAMAMRRRRK